MSTVYGKDSVTGSTDAVAISNNNLHVAQYIWDSNTLAWVKQVTSGTGVGSEVVVTNASIPVTQSGAWTVVANAGTGTFAVSGPVTDTQLRATPVPISGALTDTQLRATPIPMKLSDLYGVTRFGEQLTALRNSQMNHKPTWGISTLRYATTTTGTGAALSETNGEFRLQSGTANSTIASIQTNQRGQYQAGAMGQAGVGIRIPTAPTSTAFCEWGYTDFTNGFYYGVDGTGKYVAYVTGGVVVKVYQAAWNIDKLDGTGASGYTLNLADGNVSQVDFTWYGYGDIEFNYLLLDSLTNKIVKTTCHRFKITGSASIIDPNQPLAFRVGNGASTTTNVSMYVGGHQFSVVDGNSVPQARLGSDIVSSYATALNVLWQPILAFRKKATFNGRTNSVRVRLNGFAVSANADLEVRYSVGGTTSNLTWATPTDRTATETAVEVKLTTTGTPLTVSVTGEVLDYAFVSANGTGAAEAGAVKFDTELAIGANQEIILWVRRLSATGVMTVKQAQAAWTEEW
jgi:hypothetical protein